MAGPTTARISSGREAKPPTKASTIFAAIPRAVPRHPAWAAPITRRTRSTKKSGTQSAVLTPRATPGRAVIRPSHSGTQAGGGSSPSMTRILSPWTCPIRTKSPVRDRKGLADDGQVAADILLPVSRPKAHVEAGKRPRAHPAAPGAEGVVHEPQRRELFGFQILDRYPGGRNGTCLTIPHPFLYRTTEFRSRGTRRGRPCPPAGGR